MRRLFIRTVSVIAALLCATVAVACGDKLLAVGRGVRFQRAYAARQANLVVYSAGTHNGAALDSAKLQTTLKRAVHVLQLARDRSQLDQALRAGQVDVVLVYFADAAAVGRQLQSAASRPVILPVLIAPSKAEFAAAQKEYKFALRANADESEYLAAIDEAMRHKLKTAAKS